MLGVTKCWLYPRGQAPWHSPRIACKTLPVLEANVPGTDDPREAIAGFLRATFAEIETNSPGSNPSTRRPNARMSPYIRPSVGQWQADGTVLEGDPEAIAGAVRAVTFLTRHRDDIGEKGEAD